MSETKSPKIRLYKFASEINLSSENLIEFLKTKGHEVKSHQSILTEEMITEINAHFKKDIEKAEQHYKKIAEFNKKRADKSEKDETVVKIEEEPVQEEKVKEIVITNVSVEEGVEEIAVAEGVERETEVISVKPAGPKVPGKFVSPKTKEEGKKRGLTVVGKMDLGEDKKPKPQVKRLPTTQKAADGKPETTDSSTDAVKKKKRPKTKKKTTNEVTVEETPVAKKRKRVKKFEIDEKDVKAAIKKTMLSMDDTATTNRASSRKKKRREREAEEERLQELKTLDKNIIQS